MEPSTAPTMMAVLVDTVVFGLDEGVEALERGVAKVLNTNNVSTGKVTIGLKIRTQLTESHSNHYQDSKLSLGH